MTLLLGAGSQEQADNDAAFQMAAASSVFQELPTPDLLQGIGTATAKGLGQAAATSFLLLGDAASHVIQNFTEPAALMMGEDVEPTFAAARQQRLDLVNSLKPDPRTTGALSQVAYGLTSLMPVAAAGAVAGPAGSAALVGATQGYASYKEDVAAGMDPLTALTKANVIGTTSALGAAGPAAVGNTLLQKVASGAVINVAAGAASRGLTHVALAEGGYQEMADQYKVFDAQAIVTDALLGSAFGVLHRSSIKPSDVDAALSSNSERQYRDAAPGVPTDAESASAHDAAMKMALEQTINGDPVNIDAALSGKNFIPRMVDEHNVNAMSQAIEDGGYHDVELSAERSLLGRGEEGRGLTTDNLGRVLNRSQGDRLVIDENTFESRTRADQYIRNTAKAEGISRTDFLVEKDDNGYRVMRSSPAEVVRNDDGSVVTFRQKNRAQMYAKQVTAEEGRPAAVIKHQNGEWAVVKNVDKRAAENIDKSGFVLEAKAKLSLAERPPQLREAVEAPNPEAVVPPSPESIPVKADPEEPAAAEKKPAAPAEAVSPAVKEAAKDTEPTSILGQIMAEKPDMKIAIENDDGTTTEHSLADLVKQSDDEIAAAEKGESLFQAAISCFLRG